MPSQHNLFYRTGQLLSFGKRSALSDGRLVRLMSNQVTVAPSSGEVYKYAGATGGQVGLSSTKKQLKANSPIWWMIFVLRYSLGYHPYGAKAEGQVLHDQG